LPDGLFQTENPNLGKFLGPYIDWKMFIFLAILWIFGIFYDHLVHFELIWYILSSFGILYNENSGNPGQKNRRAPTPSETQGEYFACLDLLFQSVNLASSVDENCHAPFFATC
jgi:hypothetical protein